MSERGATTDCRLSIERVENETAYFVFLDGACDERQPWCPVERVPNEWALGHVYDAEVASEREVVALTYNPEVTTAQKTSVAKSVFEESERATFKDASEHPQVQSGSASDPTERTDD